MVSRVDALTRLTRTVGTALVMITHTVKDLESLEMDFDIMKAKGFIERAGALIVGALTSDEMDKLDSIIPFTRADKAWVSALSSPAGYDAQLEKPGPPPRPRVFPAQTGHRTHSGGAPFRDRPDPHGTEIPVARHRQSVRRRHRRRIRGTDSEGQCGMSGKRSTRGNRYGAEVRSATVILVDKLRPQYPSLWATIERVSADTGIHTSTVRAWLRQREARTP